MPLCYAPQTRGSEASDADRCNCLRYWLLIDGPEQMVIILIGVAGSGKTTVGQLLAASLGWLFRDADDFHPPRNREKMRRGIPLDDNDRRPWLEAIRASIRDSIDRLCLLCAETGIS
jgi:hypothetical protein